MATAARTQLTAEDDYIGHGFHPDCDFIDGQFQERNLGELEHSEMQEAVLAWFRAHARAWSIKVLPEMRVQTSETRFRVADAAIIAADAPRERILKTPPLLVIEILSPEDRVGRYRQRLDDYRRMGVANIWVIDPETREGFDCSSGSWQLTSRFSIADTDIHMEIAALELPSPGVDAS